MIYIADIASIGVQHEQFNKSFLDLIGQDDSDELTMFADQSHLNALSLNSLKIKTERIYVYEKRGGIKEFIRAYYQFRSLNKIVYSAESKQITKLYVLLIHPLAHFLFKFFGRKTANTYLVMHGELESVKFNKHFVNKIWGVFLKIALSTRKKNVSYIILGKSIYNNLIQVLPAFSLQTSIVLDHPYPFQRLIQNEINLNKLTFATLGVATIAKNSQHFFKLALQAKKLGLDYGFNVCGRVYKNMEKFLNEQVNYKHNFESLTRDELNSLVEESDFAVFYYDNANYSLCSSGAFWDAIDAEKPLLYVRNDYFDYYASIAGPIGIVFETPDQLNDYILTLESKKSSLLPEYNLMVNNIRNLKYNYMTSENLSNQLRSLHI